VHQIGKAPLRLSIQTQMYTWISHTLDFWLQFCEKKSAAYTWTFTVVMIHTGRTQAFQEQKIELPKKN